MTSKSLRVISCRTRVGLTGLFAVLLMVAMSLTACQVTSLALRGHLTDQSTSGPAVGVTVRVYDSTSEVVVASTVTDATGVFEVPSSSLSAGSYRVQFGESQWWKDASSWATATTVEVGGTDTTTLDASISVETGTISGSTNQVPFVKVEAISHVSHAVIATTTTKSDGTYQLLDLPTGEYTVRFSRLNGYTTRYNGSSFTERDAAVITVRAGETVPGVDTTLDSESTIAVSTVGNDNRSNLVVIAIDDSTGTAAGFATSSDEGEGTSGELVIHGLNNTGYRLVVADQNGLLQPTFYRASSDDPATGTVVWPNQGGELSVGPISLSGSGCAAPRDHSGLDLSGVDLSGQSFANCDLSGSNLSGANLSGTSFIGADLTSTNLTSVILDDTTDFTYAAITGSNISGTDLGPLGLLNGLTSGGLQGTPTALPDLWSLYNGYLIGTGAQLQHADFSGLDLSNAHLDSTDLTGANLTGADLSGVDLSGSDLTGADLTGATVSSTTRFVGSTLTATKLDGVNLGSITSADLAGIVSGQIATAPATLPVAWKFWKGFLVGPGANLDQAGLSFIDLSGIDLDGASLRGTDFSYANFSGMDLSGVAFSFCDFKGADMTNVTVSSTTDFNGGWLFGVDFGGTNLAPMPTSSLAYVNSGGITPPVALPTGWSTHASYLVGPYANLTGAHLSNLDLTGVDFSFTDLTETDFTGSTMTGVRALNVRGGEPQLPAGWQEVYMSSGTALVGPGVDLSGATISSVDLTGVDLTGANLAGATMLYGVTVTGTNLTGATLTNVNTSSLGQSSGGLIGMPAAVPTQWVLANGYLVGPTAKLTFANLAGTDLTGADLTGADLRSATFAGATGSPTGGSTSTYGLTICPDGVTVAAGGATCVGHGFSN